MRLSQSGTDGTNTQTPAMRACTQADLRAGTPVHGDAGERDIATSPPARRAALRSPALRARIAQVEAPPLHAALDYCARRLSAELDDPRAREAALSRFGPVAGGLLRWWCATDIGRVRVDNFNRLQRRALLHLLIAHARLRCDDPAQLFRRACAPAPADAHTPEPVDARHRLHLAPGSGLRWVLQAVLVWRWAEAWSAGEIDTLRITLSASSRGACDHLRTALFGTIRCDGDGDAIDHAADASTIDAGSLLRHARLFLPPVLRAPFRAWLATAAGREGALEIRCDADDGPDPLRLAATCAGRRLQVDVAFAEATNTHRDRTESDAALIEATPAAAIHEGACKLPMPIAVRDTGVPLRPHPPRRAGARPWLSRVQQRQLHAGLDALAQRTVAFVALDPARAPRMRVIAAAPRLRRAARRWLIDAGVAAIDIHCSDDASIGHAPSDASRILIDALPARDAIADPRICVVVMLRGHRDPETATATAAALLSTGAALLWPEPEFAELRHENLERVACGRPPRHLIDVLAVIDHPYCLADLPDVPCAAPTHIASATDDLFADLPRADIARHALRLPAPPCSDLPGAPLDGLCTPSRRFLRRRHAVATARSIHAHAACASNDSGLRRAFVESAEADPRIDSHCLLDPRRHGSDCREALLARGLDARGWPEAPVRTDDRVFLVEFLPFVPNRPQTPTPGECAVTRWLQRCAALPPERREGRHWCRVAVPAPLFWSWRRTGGTLSAWLASLAAPVAPAPAPIPAPACAPAPPGEPPAPRQGALSTTAPERPSTAALPLAPAARPCPLHLLPESAGSTSAPSSHAL